MFDLLFFVLIEYLVVLFYFRFPRYLQSLHEDKPLKNVNPHLAESYLPVNTYFSR